VLVVVRDGDVGSFTGKGDGDGSTDPTVSAGDEGDVVLELA
jgi:hypothetical protein